MLTHIIDDIRNLIGRPATFYSATYSGCSVCTEDPITHHSTDSFCPTCSGVYWIPLYTGTTVTGHITWGNADLLDWRTGGKMFEGDCRIQIKLENDTVDMLDATKYIVADGKVVEIQTRILRGVPELNRVLLDCIEKEKEE